jgi:hypothetical protein
MKPLHKLPLAGMVPMRSKLLNSPRFLLSLGIMLMMLGIILPFLMVIHVLESTFFLNFFSWGASVVGLSFGTIGFAIYSSGRKD